MTEHQALKLIADWEKYPYPGRIKTQITQEAELFLKELERKKNKIKRKKEFTPEQKIRVYKRRRL